MKDERVIAIDLGASSGRVIGVRVEGGVVTSDTLHRFPNGPVLRDVDGRPRWCWDVEAIMEGVLEGIAVVAAGGRVDSIGVDSWAVDYGLIDERGSLVAPVTAYRDERHRAVFERLRREIGDATIYDRTGIQFQPFNSLYQLAADAEDPGRPLERADRMLMIPDLIAHRLCGSVVGERTNAGSTQCFDVRRNDWDHGLLERAGVPARLMPPVVAGESAEPLGGLLSSIAERVGLPAGTPVRATASHDTAAAVAAAPLRGPGDLFISSGTWSLVGFELDSPVRSRAAMEINATNEPGVFGTTRLLKNVTGLWPLQECRKAWDAAGRRYDWKTLASMAEEVEPFRTVFDADHPSLSAPGDMPGRISALVAESGEPQPEDDASMARAILDSVALKTARAIVELESVSGISSQRIVVVGGGAANVLLNRLISACAGVEVVMASTEATALGNAAVQIGAMRGFVDRGSLAELLPGVSGAVEPEALSGVRGAAAAGAERLRSGRP